MGGVEAIKRTTATDDSHRTVSKFFHISFHNKDLSTMDGLESLYSTLLKLCVG